METLEEVEHAAVHGSEQQLPAQEDSTAGEQPPCSTPDRRQVDALLDISEEDFLKELEPHEYHCYSVWQEAVKGWARVAPLSCILVTQKRDKKPKHEEVDDPAPSSVDPQVPNADRSASPAEHRCESHVGPRYSFKKSMPVNQHTGLWSNTAVAGLRQDASEWPVLNAMQKAMSNLLLEEKVEEEGMLRESPLQNRPTKLQKHNHRPNNAVVPIKNFTFLPPIESPRLNPQRAGGKRAPEGETIEESCFMFDQKGGTRGTRVDPVANQTSKYRTCQHNPHLFSAVSVSLPKRYQVPVSSKRDIAHRTSFSMGRSLKHSGTAAGAQVRLRPSKTVCAAKMYEGWEINV